MGLVVEDAIDLEVGQTIELSGSAGPIQVVVSRIGDHDENSYHIGVRWAG